MSREDKNFYEFGPFRIDLEERQLLRGQDTIPLTPKAFETLLILIRSSERVVLKDDLMKALWPDSFVEESNLTQNIFVLRKALGESAQGARYIATVPGRGYRFTEKVRNVTDEPTSLVIESRSIQKVAIDEGKPQRDLLRVSLTAIALAGLVGLLLYYVVRNRQLRASRETASSFAVQNTKSRRSVAVLSFRNLSGNPVKAWLSTAHAEMVSTELAAGEKLRLISGEDIAHARLNLALADTGTFSKDTLASMRKHMGSDLVVIGSYTVLSGTSKSNENIRLDLRVQNASAGETVA